MRRCFTSVPKHLVNIYAIGKWKNWYMLICVMIICVIITTINLKIVNHQPRNSGLIEMKDKLKQ